MTNMTSTLHDAPNLHAPTQAQSLPSTSLVESGAAADVSKGREDVGGGGEEERRATEN
ncbi:MAG: hypothetical protein Q9159_005889 [Coniocarpon cinnabarinum]